MSSLSQKLKINNRIILSLVFIKITALQENPCVAVASIDIKSINKAHLDIHQIGDLDYYLIISSPYYVPYTMIEFYNDWSDPQTRGDAITTCITYV